MAHPSFSAPSRGRLISVDALRALAALAVLFSHIPFTSGSLPSPLASLLLGGVRLGRLGVPLFLVLSGFCIHLSVARRIAAGQGVRSDWGRFWRRRFWRLYPPYLATIVLSLGIYALIGEGAYPSLERIKSLPFDVLTHLLLIHNLFADYCFSLGNGPFWTLGLEEQLYACYALFLILRRRWPLGRIVGLALLVSLAWQCAWRLGWSDDAASPVVGAAPLALGRWLSWPIGYWFAWILGAIAAEAYVGAIPLPEWLTQRRTAVLLALIALATNESTLQIGSNACGHFFAWPGSQAWQSLQWFLAGFSGLTFSAAAFVLLNRWVRREAEGHFHGPLFRTLAGLGVMSYSLYLIHVPLVRLLVHWMPDGTGLDLWLLRIAVLVPASLAAAAVFFFLIERRFLLGSTTVSAAGARAPAPQQGPRGTYAPSPPVAQPSPSFELARVAPPK